MPYTDPERQRQYMREWKAARRAKYFADKVCVDCGSREELQLDHIRGEKVHHNIWSWSEKRRNAELAKCEVRCDTCHRLRHGGFVHGIARYHTGCRCDICSAAKHEEYLREVASGRRSKPIPT